MYEFLRNLFASEQPVMERFNVVDPTAVGNNVRSMTLAYTPSTDESPTSVVSLFWTDSRNKVYEKQFQDEIQAQNLFGSMKQDLQEAADLTRTEKMESAASLVRSLLKRYAIYTDELVDGNMPPMTTTNANKKKAGGDHYCAECGNRENCDQMPCTHDDDNYVCSECKSHPDVGSPQWVDDVVKQYEEENSRMGYIADKDDFMKHLMYVANEEAMGFNIDEKTLNQWVNEWAAWKSTQKKSSLGKVAKVVMQNLFFETPEELKKYQDMQKGSKPGADKQVGDFKDDLPPMDKDKAPGEELGEEMQEDGLAPSSLSYEDFEKQKAQEQKSLSKRIEKEVKDQVKSALERKIASTFDETDDELIDAMRKKGRTWEEIKNYFTKELQYEKDSVAAYIDALREAEHGQMPNQQPKAPAAPKPPADLVSPETHDKLVKEIDDKKPVMPPAEHEIEKHDMALGEIALQNTEIQKVAEEPLETIPKSRPQTGKDFDFLPDDTEMADEMNDDPAAAPDPGDVMDVHEEQLIPGPDTKVYVMRDYQSGEGGYEGTLVSKYTSSGEEFAVVDVNGDMKEVPMRDVKRASIFRRIVKMAVERKQKRDAEKAVAASSELKAITSELQSLYTKVAEQAIAFQRGEGYLMRWITDYELDSDARVQKITRSELSYDQKVAELQKLIPEIMNNLSDDEIDIRSSDWDSPEINIGPLSKYIESEEEMYQIEKEDQGKTSASLKTAAPKCPQCGSSASVTPAHDNKLNKCDACHLAFDTDEESSEKDASLKVADHGEGNCPRCGTNIKPGKEMCDTCKKQLKEAAPTDKPALSPADPKAVPETKVKGPELDEPWKKAPEGLREEKPVLAPQEVQVLYNQVKDTEIKIQKIKTATDEIMKKAVEDVRKFKEEGGERGLTEQYQKGVQQLYAALDALNAKVVEVDSTLLAFIKEKGREEVKWSAAEKLKRAMEKFPEIEKYLENALNGAQSQAQQVEKQMIIPFPKKTFQLSRFDKRADLMDTLNYILENIKAATAALSGTEDVPQLA